MKNEHKTEIAAMLKTFMAQYANDSAAVSALKGVSHSTIISIRDVKWDNISDQMWRNVGKQVGWSASGARKKVVVQTRDLKTMLFYFSLAKNEGETFSIVGGRGFGKSFAGKHYRDTMKSKNVYYLECAEYWTPKHFLGEIIQAMGRHFIGSIYEMMGFIIAEMRKQDSPLIILDEVDKLDDKSFRFFITLYNKLNKMCGVVWTATDNISRRMNRGLRLGKTGYEEIYSRIGSTHINLAGTNYEEVKAICVANGITDMEEINRLNNEYGGDLRRVDRVILKNKIKSLKAA